MTSHKRGTANAPHQPRSVYHFTHFIYHYLHPLMNMTTRILSTLILTAFVSTAYSANWPAWRGPTGIGVSEEKSFPEKWSQSENVKWRAPLPEAGNSTPIVW